MELDLLLDILQSEDQEVVRNALLEFNQENIGELVIKFLERDLQPSCQLVSLETVRILSRDKHALAPFATSRTMRVLARLAGIERGSTAASASGEEELKPREAPDGEVASEALKCLCNTVYNSAAAQEVAGEMRLVSGLAERLKLDGGGRAGGHRDCRFYELRLTFLLTALRLDVRRQLARELRGVALLTDALEAALDLRWLDVHEVASARGGLALGRQETDHAMEVLKILFNVTFDTNRRPVDEEDAALYRHLVAILRHCLLTDSDSKERTQEFHGHAVNLLVNLPLTCLDVLLVPKVNPGSAEYMGMNMDTVEILLDFMDKRLDRGLKLRESLTPVLSLLTESSRYHRETRKFLRARVLPPLRDVTNRPEVGEALRNKLVRLMTHINTDVKHCAAEFLFVLCKENVSRFVKYTGYGNAAGLLAARGLLGGGRGSGKYSEEEDSDTEEYKEAKPNINPVTGRVEEKLPDPMEGMTDEQKEYEAMKLVSMFSKLSREQIFQPMAIDHDGNLTPLDETVQQLAEQISLHSDSDLELD
uniref:chaperone Ric-8A-like isoform X2 n=1 Tax=Pristiophorus japonicus TaxID=55135 RepID=UPI00398F6343